MAINLSDSKFPFPHGKVVVAEKTSSEHPGSLTFALGASLAHETLRDQLLRRFFQHPIVLLVLGSILHLYRRPARSGKPEKEKSSNH
jgi:hypothetical protein